MLLQQMIMDLVWEEMESATGVMQFMIPDEASSRIIGRGGAFIKQLQRESGCKINTLDDVELRSGLKARVMNVCGNRSSMSKGLYLIARKIASRWEYELEWEGGDPTLPHGQGLPPQSQARGVPEPMEMELDSSNANYRGRRGGRRNARERDSRDGRGGGRRDNDHDGGGGRSGGGGGSGGGGSGGGGRDGYNRGGASNSTSYDAAAAVAAAAGVPPNAQPKPAESMAAPWTDSSLLASVAAAAAGAGNPAAAANSTESWARLLGQIPPAARERLGIGSAQLAAAAAVAGAAGTAPASDVYGRVLTGGAVAAPQQQAPPQQPAQVTGVSEPLEVTYAPMWELIS